MEVNNEIKVKSCCALCDNLYNKEKCPLFEVYNSARNYGNETFDTEAKYKICCPLFVLNEKLRWWQKEKRNYDRTNETSLR